jgi:hypothetical protein
VEIICSGGGFLQQFFFFWGPWKKNPTKIWGASPPLYMERLRKSLEGKARQCVKMVQIMQNECLKFNEGTKSADWRSTTTVSSYGVYCFPPKIAPRPSRSPKFLTFSKCSIIFRIIRLLAIERLGVIIEKKNLFFIFFLFQDSRIAFNKLHNC